MFQSFLNGLSKIGRQWQVVDDQGEVFDREDASSIASDWSIMNAESDSEADDRPSSPSLLNAPSDRTRSPSSLPNSLDSPVRQDPDDAASPGAVQMNANGNGRVRRRASLAADRSAVLQHLELPNPAQSRQAACRWNAVTHNRNSRRSTLNVDNQRAKCLRRGAQISTGFQRKQVRLMGGGKIPQGRRTAAMKA